MAGTGQQVAGGAARHKYKLSLARILHYAQRRLGAAGKSDVVMRGTPFAGKKIDKVELRGPLGLDSEKPRTKTWLAKIDQSVVASVTLVFEQDQVAEIRDLTLGDHPMKQVAARRLIEAIGLHAREHGILKLKVHRESASEWVGKILTAGGFKDGNDRPGQHVPTKFYLDLYASLKKPGAKAATHAFQVRMAS